jgi:predicted metalloprotease with PDZ domain
MQIGGVSLGPAWIKATNNSSRSLGNKFWSDYKVHIDFESDRILLERVKESKQSMSGFGFVPRLVEDKWIVGSVIIESAAFDQGLRPGDEIVRINDKDYFEVSADEYCRQFLDIDLIPEDDYIIIDVRTSDENHFEKQAELERVEFFDF